MNRANIIRLGIEAGMKPSEAQPAINAIGRTVPVVWLELFAAMVEAEALQAHQQAIEAAVLAERNACALLADEICRCCFPAAACDAAESIAEEIRDRSIPMLLGSVEPGTQPMRTPDAHKED